MNNKLKNKTGSGSRVPEKSAPVSPPESVNSDDVEKVLEHISSPYRWELLEVPEVRTKTSVPKKAAAQKSGAK